MLDYIFTACLLAFKVAADIENDAEFSLACPASVSDSTISFSINPPFESTFTISFNGQSQEEWFGIGFYADDSGATDIFNRPTAVGVMDLDAHYIIAYWDGTTYQVVEYRLDLSTFEPIELSPQPAFTFGTISYDNGIVSYTRKLSNTDHFNFDEDEEYIDYMCAVGTSDWDPTSSGNSHADPDEADAPRYGRILTGICSLFLK